MKIDLPCKLEERVSEKTGNPYIVVVIQLTPTYEKRLFLDPAEIELAIMTYGNNHSQDRKSTRLNSSHE